MGCTVPKPIHTTDTADTNNQPTDSPSDDSGETIDSTLSGEWDFGNETVAVESKPRENSSLLRQYTIRSTRFPSDTRTITEEDGAPRLRSGHLLTDALFAMAITEAKENSVSQISDGAFSEPVDCQCYQTGAEWNWVWTRDIGYAVDLGLKHLNTERSWNSLWFKTSERKVGGGREIIQDTGTAGSWPVSTDRVVWTRGAMSIWRQTEDPTIKTQIIEVLTNTVQTDQAYVLDPRDGLYRGETSFLDWREQTYPQWMIDTPSHIAMSKSLSTNLNHLYTLRALEELTDEDWGAENLATAIDQHFWTGTHYASFIATDLFSQPVYQQDLLATSLAVLELGTHPEALSTYPHTAFGAPVIHPQQQQTPIYHNRANWPFVSAYALLAARHSNQGQIFNTHLNALIAGAALNLSNMENWEIQTGQPWFDDGEFSGPVINSKRQLWSVAGFIGAIVDGVFALHFENGTWLADPILPNDWFTSEATLFIHGQTFALSDRQLDAGEITWLDESDWRNIYAPQPPTLNLIPSENGVQLDPTPLEEGTNFQLYRNGQPFNPSTNVPLDTPTTTTCYGLTTQFEGSSHHSHPANPICWWGNEYSHILSIPFSSFSVVGGHYAETHGRPHQDNWGLPDHSITGNFVTTRSGTHLFQVVYGNGLGGLDSGITSAVKWVRIRNATNDIIAEQALVMPQLGDWDRWADSNFIGFEAEAHQTLSFEITDGLNMSYFDHYQTYTGSGGGTEHANFVNIAEAKILFRGTP